MFAARCGGSHGVGRWPAIRGCTAACRGGLLVSRDGRPRRGADRSADVPAPGATRARAVAQLWAGDGGPRRSGRCGLRRVCRSRKGNLDDVAHRGRRGNGRGSCGRRGATRVDVGFAFPASSGVLLWSAAAGILLRNDVFEPAVRSALYSVGLGLAASAIAASEAGLLAKPGAPTTADIVRDGGTAEVRIGLRSPDGTEFENIGGATLLLPPRRGDGTNRARWRPPERQSSPFPPPLSMSPARNVNSPRVCAYWRPTIGPSR